MDNVVKVAAYITKKYRELTSETLITNSELDELKLHKLLYFAQRECFAVLGKPAFEGELQGWRHGPVSVAVRQAYPELCCMDSDIAEDVAYVINNVILEYGSYTSWKLREMSHNELSWIKSREGLLPNENGNKALSLEDIKEDAKKVRPYDHVWDMYYDEFEDAETCQA